MSRVSVFSSPLFLGFEQLERLFDEAAQEASKGTAKGGEGYPPYNIERQAGSAKVPERWRITLAVAGFPRDSLDVTVEDRQLQIRGQKAGEDTRDFLHKGIAGRSFARSFVLADGMEVEAARLENGLLTITLYRRQPDKKIIRIDVKE